MATLKRSPRGVDVKRFYRNYCRPPKFEFSEDFSYDDTGDMEQRKDGVTKPIRLPTYRRTTREELHAMEEERNKRIRDALEVFDRARMELHEELQKSDRDRNRIHELNRNVRDADMALQRVRYAYSRVEREKGYAYREIDFTNSRDTRTYPHQIHILQTFPFPLQAYHVREVEGQAPAVISLEEAKAQEQAQALPQVILFGSASDLEYGFMSLNWAVEIEFRSSTDQKSTLYHSATQAILAEMAKHFRDNVGLDHIMAATEPESVQYTVSNVPGNREENEIRWKTHYEKLLYDVNLAKFQQYPALAQQLLQTGEARLGATEPMEVGIGADDAGSKNPAFWKGQNELGKALMQVREYLKTHQPAVLPEVVQNKRASRLRRRPNSLTAANAAPDSTAPLPSQPSMPVPIPMQSMPMSVPIPSQPVQLEPVPMQSLQMDLQPVQLEPMPTQSVPLEPMPIKSIQLQPPPVSKRPRPPPPRPPQMPQPF